ncbi:PAS domain S-box protein, partial [Thermoproteota archaeon]
MSEDRLKVLIVGIGESIKNLIELFFRNEKIHIVGVVDLSKDPYISKLTSKLGIQTSSDLGKFCKNGELDVVVSATDKTEVLEELHKLKPPNVEVVRGNSFKFMHHLVGEHRRIEGELRAAEEKYHTIFDNSAVAITVADSQERIVSWNKFTEDLFGMAKEDLYLKPVSSFYSQEEWKHIRSQGVRLKGIQHHLETKAIKKSGEVIDVDISISVLRDSDDSITGSIGIIRDITERKHTERELRIAEEKYRTIFDNSAVAITVADAQERIVSWNKFTEDIFGMSKDDLYLKPVSSFYSNEEWENIRSQNIRQKGMQHHLETKAIRKDGRIIDVDISISVLKDADGYITGSIGIIRDITERKQAEREMAEAYEIKSEFTSMVSHELRTPLTALKESIDIILDKSAGSINEEQQDFLTVAKRNVDRLTRLINDVLDYQKLESGKMEFHAAASDINMLANEIKDYMFTLAESKGLEFSIELQDDLPKLPFDRDKITQVLTNLVDNSIKFTEEGSIAIKTFKNNEG